MKTLADFIRRLALAGLVCTLLAANSTSAAEAYITIDATTGHILEQFKADKKRQVGSLTKIATAMVTLDWASHQSGALGQVATIPQAAFWSGNEDPIGFQPGDTVSLRDLLYAALIQSDNIAAYTLADYVGHVLQTSAPAAGPASANPVDFFVLQMNALARRLGMERTRFLNPSGIDTREKPFSTAADVAKLSRYAMRNAGFRFYVSQKEREISFLRGPTEMRYLLRNTNELLGTDNIDGVKTGSTPRAGDCLVLSAGRPAEVAQEGTKTLVTPRRVIVVVLASPDRFREGAALLARGWQLYDQWAAAGRPFEPKQTLNLPNE